MDINKKLEKAEKLIYQIQRKKDLYLLIEELDKLKFLNCPLSNLYIYDLLFTSNFPAEDAANRLVKGCPICYLISLVIVAKEEDWTLDELRRKYLKFIYNKEN